MFKKITIGLGVLGVFAIYSLLIRHQTPVIGKPQTTSTTAAGGTTSSSTKMGTPSGVTYKDGSYTGSVADAYYGSVQVATTISGGKITKVNFLQYPNTHSTSVAINQQAMPYLQQEAIAAQSANVQVISGATYTSQAFAQSLDAALTQAKS